MTRDARAIILRQRSLHPKRAIMIGGQDKIMLKQCSVCGSDRIIPGAIIEDKNRSFDQRMYVVVDRKPTAFLLRHSLRGALRAWICGVCGHADLFVGNPGELYQAYLDGLEDQRQHPNRAASASALTNS